MTKTNERIDSIYVFWLILEIVITVFLFFTLPLVSYIELDRVMTQVSYDIDYTKHWVGKNNANCVKTLPGFSNQCVIGWPLMLECQQQ